MYARFEDVRAFLCVFMSFRALGIRGKCPRSHFVPTDYWPLIIAKSFDFDLKHPVMIDHRAFRASVIVLIYMIARSIVFQYSERAKHPGSLNRRDSLLLLVSANLLSSLLLASPSFNSYKNHHNFHDTFLCKRIIHVPLIFRNQLATTETHKLEVKFLDLHLLTSVENWKNFWQ